MTTAPARKRPAPASPASRELSNSAERLGRREAGSVRRRPSPGFRRRRRA
ncbi:hypothetical protein HMPREF0972_01390 [Actinomyces sp. oral taxon 848 str. F0332]|nr:hypothetical protein HMPREF0972_01390 [Actinomyces sp. oral taxon 848 str. F0332]